MKKFILSGLVLLLCACGVAETSTPYPTPEAINIFYTSDLQPWADHLGSCAARNPQAAAYFLPASTDNYQLRSNDIALELGDPSPDSGILYISQLGWEQVEVIVNPENNLSTLTLDQLRDIYAGRMTAWEHGSGQSVEVWVLPDGNPVRSFFDQRILPDQRLTSEARLAPDPSAMLEAIAQGASAIGYLPASSLYSSGPDQIARVKILPITELPKGESRLPVIALTLGEPLGIMRQVLVCLQSDPP